jgi:hypothetical protein
MAVHLAQISPTELEVTLRNTGTAAQTVFGLSLGLDKAGGAPDERCWALLVPGEKALLPKQEYRFTVRPDTLQWCRESNRDDAGSCAFHPLREVALPGSYLARAYQHKDSPNDPTSNSIAFEVLGQPQ